MKANREAVVEAVTPSGSVNYSAVTTSVLPPPQGHLCFSCLQQGHGIRDQPRDLEIGLLLCFNTGEYRRYFRPISY